MITNLWTAVRITFVTLLIFGVAYPLSIWGIGSAFFPTQSRGSLIVANHHVIGSSIIGQRWTRARDFQGRPSAAGKNGYDPTATGGSNLGPDSATLFARIRASIASQEQHNPGESSLPPIDLITVSASGIDPDISPKAAYYQAARVARARRVPLPMVRRLIAENVRPRELGILGEPRVNVLRLNLALDELLPSR